MRILIVHNQYQQSGGEDSVVKAEFNILKNAGEDVYLYERSNKEFNDTFWIKKLKLLYDMKWSHKSYQDMRAILKKIHPDVVHFHNIFFILTPSVYQACKDEGVPVVQSLHNFRLLCSNALFFRNNKICEECIEKKDLNRGIVHKCYRNSRVLTTVIVRMLKFHWRRRTRQTIVDHFILASAFGRQKYIAAGIPKDQISIKPNVVYPDTLKQNQDEGYALYIGRLSSEKGVSILLEAWKAIDYIPLKIAGDGPLASELKEYVRIHGITNVEFLGFISEEQYKICMSGAKFLVIPSICYENFPCVVVEAYSYGIPIVASNIGSLPEVVEDRVTGVIFGAGDTHDLTRKIEWIAKNEEGLKGIRKNILQQYEQRYSSRRIHEILMTIYKKVIGGRKDSSVTVL